MSRLREGPGLLVASALVAILLGLVPIPDWMGPFRPYWIGLVLAYWALEAPQRVGLGIAFVIGFMADLIYGTLLGEQALRLTILVFLVLRFRPRLRFFPPSQQALAILALLINDRVVVLAVRMFTGEGMPPPLFWAAPVVGMLLWPWLFLLLDDLRLRSRSREG
jgi:rod shape-determining protein MreD